MKSGRESFDLFTCVEPLVVTFKNSREISLIYTLFEIFIFCPKIQLWFPEKIVNSFGWKIREYVVVLYFLAVDNFDFTR